MRKVLSVLLLFILSFSMVTMEIKAEEYYIDVALKQYSGISMAFDMTINTNCPMYYQEVYYPDGTKRGLTTMFPGNMFKNETYVDMSSYNDYDGVYLLVFYYEDCREEVSFTIENSEQYRALQDQLTGNENSNSNDKDVNTGNKNNGTNHVTAITISENKIEMYPEEQKEVTVTSSKSITVEIEDTNIINATYSNGVLTINALRAGTSEIWLKTNDNYINISVKVMNDTAKGASAWAKEDIRKAIEDGFVPGEIMGNWTRNIAREDFAKMAVLFLDLKPIYSKTPFTDTTNPYVTAAYEAGIVAGVGDGKFNPKGNITRQEAAVMLMRVAKSYEMEIDNETAKFKDDADIASWASDAVIWAKNSDIMQGDDAGNFNPLNGYTWEQAVVTFVRLKNIIDQR